MGVLLQIALRNLLQSPRRTSLLGLAIGLVTSFVVGWAVIAVFLRWLKTRGLEPFGWYRVALGAAVLLFAQR